MMLMQTSQLVNSNIYTYCIYSLNVNVTICKSWSFISFPWGLGALYGCFFVYLCLLCWFFLVFLCLFVITCACSWSSMSLWGFFVSLYRCFCPSLCCLCFPVSFVVILRSSAVILYLFVVDLLVFAVAMYWFLVIFCLSLLLFWFQQFVAPLYIYVTLDVMRSRSIQ